MSNNLSKSKIADGIEVLAFEADRFKTNTMTVTLSTPLNKKTASENAIVANLLSHSCKKYPSLSVLNKHLAYMYGATVSPCVSKNGETQLISINISSLDDRFSLDDTKISSQCAELIKELLLFPNLEDGLFYEDDIEREKRLLIEEIESEENEKRTYAVHRLEQEMFKNEAYSTQSKGSKEDVMKITKESATLAWKNLLKTAKITVIAVGNVDFKEIESFCQDAFKSLLPNRDYKESQKSEIFPKAEKVTTVEERMDIKQGKLVLGFRVNLAPDSTLAPAMKTTVDVFGGGPYSRLFANVREKMSLCYYCSARYIREKSAIIVQCGCEEENMDKAVAEIQNQLNFIESGDISTEFKASKVAISDMIKTVFDSPDLLGYWLESQVVSDEYKTPDEVIEENEAVTMAEVKDCSNLISLDTVFKLMSKEEK